MHDNTEHIERMISRRLDGELDGDQQLELDRALIRDPLAHRLMEQTQRLDEICCEALGALFLDRAEQARSSFPDVRPAAHRRAPRSSRWLIPGAVAAALLAMVIPFPGKAPVSKTASRGRGQTPQAVSINTNGTNGLYRNISVPKTHRSLGRDILGVVAEDGNVYWIEVDRSRTVRVTPPDGGLHGTERM